MENAYLYLAAYFWINALILGALMMEANRKGPLVLLLTVILTPLIGLPGAVIETLYKHLVYPVYEFIKVNYSPSFYFYFYFGSRFRNLSREDLREFKGIEKKYRKSKMLKHHMLHKRVKMVLDREKSVTL